MSEDKVYKDGDIVWVKLGNNWWPGEVTGPARHPEGLITHLKRVPYCVVKFFNENTYEYVRSGKQIFPFQCPKQDEFIRKGYSLYNSGNTFMEKFPADVEVARQLIRRKESSSFIINDRPDSIVKAILGQPLIRTQDEWCEGSEQREKRHSTDSVTKILNITPNRNNDAVRSQQPKAQTCDFCDFTSARLNVMILHRKIHNNRNSLGSSNAANNSAAKQISPKTAANLSLKSVANTNVDGNGKKRQNQTSKHDINNKTKVITVPTTKAASPRTPSPPSRLAPVNKTNMAHSANKMDDSAAISSKEKNNGNMKFTTPRTKSKAARNSTVQENKEENAYAAILSDFCPSETETSSSEEKQSRRSLRHSKNVAEPTAEKLPTVYIDLSESKTIQKIPKKREYSTFQLVNDNARPIISPALIVGDPDVVCISDKEKSDASPNSRTVQSATTKKDAEDIRRMLLADWSDDDETPADTSVIDESVVLVNSERQERLAAVKEVQNSAPAVAASTPLITTSTATTGRIRNIPKKDRRDVVLQDFNSDLSFIQYDHTDHVANKPVAVDLDSSNSSVVEIIEEQLPATVITINDDEDQEVAKTPKGQDDAVSAKTKANDSSVFVANDKSISAATSSSTLSCFDFQDDEDEQDNSTTTISHFKKKFLSGEKLQSVLANTADDAKDLNASKNRAELAEKDQRLAADIENLLEQTQPTVVDLLNTSSFEESLSVKDLPIKERGKRIFKSRNKTRLADKASTELSAPAEISFSLTQLETRDVDKFNTIDDEGSPNKGQGESVEIPSNQEDLANNKCSTDIPNQQVLVGTQAEISNCLEDTESIPNCNNNDETSIGGNKDCLEKSIDDNNTSHSDQLLSDKSVASDITNENMHIEEQPIDMMEEQNDKSVLNSEVTEQSPAALDFLVSQQQEPEQENLEAIDQPQAAAEETIMTPSEIYPNDETQTEAVLYLDDKGFSDAVHVPSSNLNDVQIKVKPQVDKVKVLEVKILKQSLENSENDLRERLTKEIAVTKFSSEIKTKSDMNSPKKMDDSRTSDKDSENAAHKMSSESIFKIRVKSPEKLLDQAFVMASQQDQELQRTVDMGIDGRLASTSPTDENSSMGASDTGAEFGSPTSMLSEERLPAFRFQSNRTPQPETETAKTPERLMHNVPEVVQDVSNEGIAKSNSADHLVKEHLADKTRNCKVTEPKSLLQRRFSMDINSLQTEPKSIKRQRLSVDGIAGNQENSMVKKGLHKSLTIPQEKTEINIRPKSRHMKITPRRNVSELFKEYNSRHFENVDRKCGSLNKIPSPVNCISTAMKREEIIKSGEVSPVKENCNKVLNEKQEKITEAIHPNKEIHEEASDNNVPNENTENKDTETTTDPEILHTLSEKNQQEENQQRMLTETVSSEKEDTGKEQCVSQAEVQVKVNVVSCSTKETDKDCQKIEEIVPVNREEIQQENLKPNADNGTLLKSGGEEVMDVISNSISEENIDKDSAHAQNVCEISPVIPIIAKEIEENNENNKCTASDTLALVISKTHKDPTEKPTLPPEIPPSTSHDHEDVIEQTQHETPATVDSLSDVALLPLTPKEKENSSEITNQSLMTKESILNESDEKENQPLREVECPLTPLAKDSIVDASDVAAIPANERLVEECETLVEPSTSQLLLDTVIEFDNTLPMPCTPRESNIQEYDNVMQIPSTSQAKDLIIECQPSTPQGIIECDDNLPAQITPEKEVIIESDVTSDKCRDIIIEENLHLDDREILLEREFQVIEPKKNCVPIDIPQEPQTDADKAAEEFLIEFDSIVNHSHTAEGEAHNIAVEDLINNIIEEVHEEPQPKEDTTTKSEPSIQFEPLTTYALVTNKNTWHQIFKDSFNKQLINPAKRRQTICFEISDTKEGVACKKQAFDIESVLPANKTIKRTAERKLTLPAMETRVLTSNSQPHSTLAYNNNPITLNKKLIPTPKRKLSLEDNIKPFIIERPKQHQNVANAVSGPPPLQRIRPLRRQSHIIAKTNVESMSEPPSLQCHDNVLNDLFPAESSTSTQRMDLDLKAEGGRVIHHQIISGPNPSLSASIHQNKSADSKISTNKQIGVDSRGNKYVIIKTPPTDIVVQPTLTPSTAASIPAANNFGTTITFQPLARASSEISKTKPVSKTKSISKEQLQQQQMKQISITVPAKSALEVAHLPEITAKTALRNRRKAAQAKAVAAAATATANSNLNSAKHRQAIEALSRRLSIASEAPPLAKISRTTSATVQTQFPSNSNISTLIGDAQISNIAQQQLIQLQQQQQQQQTLSSPLPPPIILNKNAHQHSVIQRKARKFPSQQQTHLQHQQLVAAKPSHLLQQNSVQQQSQQLQPQIIAQIALQQQTQQHNSALQPPPLLQIQQQTEQLPQQTVQQSGGVNTTAGVIEDDDVIISNSQLIALPTQPYPGYPNTFLLCKVKGNTCKPVDNVPLYLNEQLNELVPVPLEAIQKGHKTPGNQIEIKSSNAAPQQLLTNQNNEPQTSESNLQQMANINCTLVDDGISAGIELEHQNQNSQQQQQIMEDSVVDENGAAGSNNQICDFAGGQELNTESISNNGILLNIEGQQVLLDASTFAHLLANPDANTQLISDDGTEYVLTHEVLQALQLQQEQQQALELLNAAAQQQQQLEQTASNDIIAVALAGSDLYDNDVLTIDTSQGMQLIDGDGSIVFPAQTGSITQQHLTPPAVVTNAVLDQSPIMSTLEVPSSLATAHKLQGTQLITVPSHHLATSTNAALGLGGRANLEDSLAAIGVTSQASSIPSSLGLPITVTNPNIASKVTSAGPLNEMLQFVSHRPATAAATAAAVAAAALAGEPRIFAD